MRYTKRSVQAYLNNNATQLHRLQKQRKELLIIKKALRKT